MTKMNQQKNDQCLSKKNRRAHICIQVASFHIGNRVKSTSKFFLIENQFHVALSICSPETSFKICLLSIDMNYVSYTKVVPNLFNAFLSLLILELFIPSYIT